MSGNDGGTSYFIRVRGRVLGPYTVKQLNTLRVRGQFSQSNEISSDGKTWESAATLEALFGAPTKKSQRNTTSTGDGSGQTVEDRHSSTVPIATVNAGALWHYSIDGEQLGPVTQAELEEMIAVGRLSLFDLVWKDGMSEWCRAAEIPELKQLLSPKRRSRAKSTRPDDQTNNSENHLASHFLDHALTGLRSVVDASFVSAMGRSSVELGRYAIYLSILFNIVFCFISAVKFDSVDIGLAGVGFAVVALVLQFSAVKSCGAIAQLIRSTTLRMSSTAFLDSVVIMSLIGGIVLLVTYSVLWVRHQETVFLIIGIGGFVACEQLGLMLLHPSAIGITISNRSHTGEEAIAILSFFMTLPLRFVPAVFAFGSVCSILGTAVALYWILVSSSDSMAMIHAGYIATTSGVTILACAAFPFVAYVYFVFAYLIVDVVRSILVVPDKLDELGIKIVKSREAFGSNDERLEGSVSDITA